MTIDRWEARINSLSDPISEPIGKTLALFRFHWVSHSIPVCSVTLRDESIGSPCNTCTLKE